MCYGICDHYPWNVWNLQLLSILLLLDTLYCLWLLWCVSYNCMLYLPLIKNHILSYRLQNGFKTLWASLHGFHNCQSNVCMGRTKDKVVLCVLLISCILYGRTKDTKMLYYQVGIVIVHWHIFIKEAPSTYLLKYS